jgi:hypothetical protein
MPLLRKSCFPPVQLVAFIGVDEAMRVLRAEFLETNDSLNCVVGTAGALGGWRCNLSQKPLRAHEILCHRGRSEGVRQQARLT